MLSWPNLLCILERRRHNDLEKSTRRDPPIAGVVSMAKRLREIFYCHSCEISTPRTPAVRAAHAARCARSADYRLREFRARSRPLPFRSGPALHRSVPNGNYDPFAGGDPAPKTFLVEYRIAHPFRCYQNAGRIARAAGRSAGLIIVNGATQSSLVSKADDRARRAMGRPLRHQQVGAY